MVPVTDFLPTLRMLVDVPVPGLMETAIVKAAQKFCRESKVLVRERQYAEVYSCQLVSVVSNQVGPKGKVQLKGAGIISVSSKGQRLEAGHDYSVVGLDKVKFNADFMDVKITGIAEPLVNATQLPAELLNDYCDGICAGAASILQLQPTTAWFNPELASFNQREYVQSIRDAYRYTIENTPALEEPQLVRRREFY
ncbi:hypothetical protein [Photobacterium nomapromontoriensis]|uniref:hypothetical protein n=1 Tax=Photobacterium nomapromontoriensis TaxID=2910237 RepID=UPI003D113A4E